MISRIFFMTMSLIMGLSSVALSFQDYTISPAEIMAQCSIKEFHFIDVEQYQKEMAATYGIPGSSLRVSDHPSGKELLFVAGEYATDSPHASVILVLTEKNGKYTLLKQFDLKPPKPQFLNYRNDQGIVYIVYSAESDHCSYIEWLDNDFVLKSCGNPE